MSEGYNIVCTLKHPCHFLPTFTFFFVYKTIISYLIQEKTHTKKMILSSVYSFVQYLCVVYAQVQLIPEMVNTVKFRCPITFGHNHNTHRDKQRG